MDRRENFYHGTSVSINPGGKVLPAKTAKRAQHFKQINPGTEAFATTNEDVAWTFAQHSGAHTGKRPRVYEVQPNEQSELGKFNSKHPKFRGGRGDDLAEHVAPSWEVETQHDIMPGRQGTFPQLNWKQFSSVKLRKSKWLTTAGDPVNHPSNAEVARSMGPSSTPTSPVAQESTPLHPNQQRMF